MSRARLALGSIAVAGALVAASLAGAAWPTAASGEVAEQGNLVVRVDGSISPRRLPRERRAPVAMRVSSAFATTDGSHPPHLRRARIEFHRDGRLTTRGLPRCTEPQLRTATSQEALRSCGGALIGRGRVESVIAFPDMAPLALDGRLLAFNARRNGRPAVLAHTFVSDPVPVSYVVEFEVRRGRRGPYGMSLIGRFPTIARDLGYVTNFTMRLGRTYRHRGKRRSYLSAACGVPKGLTVTLFPLARTTFDFADGRRLSTSLERVCRVRR